MSVSTADDHSPGDFDEIEDAFLPSAATITVVEVDLANRDDDNECHIFDVAGNHVGFAHLGGTFAGSSLSRISEVVGHPDQALVARALTSLYCNGSSFFRVLGIAHRAVETLSECGSQEVPNRLADECGPEVLSISKVDEFGVETFVG